jgi:peptide/nickel transport system substrate-binding protein
MEGDGIDYLRKVPVEFYSRVVAPGKLEGFRFPTREYLYVAWNARRSPWNRPEVRGALTALIDRKALAARFEGNAAAVAEGPVPPGDPGHEATLRSPPYDPAGASARLSEAGLKRSSGGVWLDAGGRPVRVVLLCLARNSLHQDTATLVADSLRTGGFETEVRTLEIGPLREKVRTGDFDGALFVRSDRLPVDLASCFGSGGGDNWAGLSDPELDGRVAEEESATDPATARKAFSLAYRRVVALQPWTFLYYRSECAVRHPRLRGLEANPREALAYADRWWIAPGTR